MRLILNAKSKKGFTLLELIIVLFLISLILGLSIISFANFLPSYRFNSTARDIATTLKHARYLAQIQGIRQVFTIDLDSKTYGIEGYNTKEIPEDINIKILDPIHGEIYKGKYYFVISPTGIETSEIILSYKKKVTTIQMDPIVGTLLINQ
jgi:general secretion pathway protein H